MSVQPRFVAVFAAKLWRYAKNVDKGVIDTVVHIAYDETGQRWGFVERITGGSGWYAKEYKAATRVARGWVKLPTKILDETWEESL